MPCGVRNLCFTIVGYLVMLISNSAAGNAGVDKSYDLTPTPVMHYRSERTNQAVARAQAIRHYLVPHGTSERLLVLTVDDRREQRRGQAGQSGARIASAQQDRSGAGSASAGVGRQRVELLCVLRKAAQCKY